MLKTVADAVAFRSSADRARRARRFSVGDAVEFVDLRRPAKRLGQLGTVVRLSMVSVMVRWHDVVGNVTGFRYHRPENLHKVG